MPLILGGNFFNMSYGQPLRGSKRGSQCVKLKGDQRFTGMVWFKFNFSFPYPTTFYNFIINLYLNFICPSCLQILSILNVKIPPPYIAVITESESESEYLY